MNQNLNNPMELKDILSNSNQIQLKKLGRRAAEYKKAAQEFIENNKYLFYEPNGKAEQFIKAFGSGEKTIYFFLGGNGTSKSATLANIVANICFKEKNSYFKGLPLFDNWPFLKKIRIISDPTTIQEKTVPELYKWFPRGRYTTLKNKKAFESQFSTDTGFDISLMSYEQDVKEFESVDLGAVFFDEPPPEKIFNACIGRLRLGGVVGGFMTPLASAGFLYDKYIGTLEGAKLCDFVEVDVEENCKQHGIRGFLDHKNIELMLSNYDEYEKEARAHGRFMHLVGRVFKELDRKKHILETFEETVKRWPYKSWKVFWAIDPHPVIQTAVSFMAILSDGRKVIIDEIWEHLEVNKMASEIVKRLIHYKELGGQISDVGLIDPSSVIEDQLRGGESVKIDFIKHWRNMGASLVLIEGSKDRDRAEDMLHQELKGTINPNLYFCSNCSRTVWEFEHYSVNPKNPMLRSDKNDHFIEDIGRLCLNNPHNLFRTTKEEKRVKHIKGIGS